jgi:sporulation protein YlmC with PRC-barrel domain
MRLPLLLCVTSLVATTALAQRETSPSSSPSSQPGSSSKSSQSSQTGTSSQSSNPSLSPTGRGSGQAGQQQCFRSTKLIGAQVKSSSGEDVGRIEDVVINPTSGKIDLAVISSESKLYPVPWQLLSVSGQGGQGSQSSSSQGSSSSTSSSTSPSSSSTSPSSTSPSSPTSPSSTSPSTSPSASAGVYASSSASMGQQPTFILNVDKTKLQSAPSFDRSRWPEMNASWTQRIYAHFGVQADTGVGGTGSGSFKSSTQSDQGSTGKSSDTDSGKSSSDTDSSSSPSKSKSSSDTKK